MGCFNARAELQRAAGFHCHWSSTQSANHSSHRARDRAYGTITRPVSLARLAHTQLQVGHFTGFVLQNF
jgi:hypothetical protein